MTVSTTVRTAGPFLGTGAVSVYAFAFKVFLTTDVLVQFTSATGVLSTGTLGTDYSVSLNADQNGAPGGVVVLTVPLASGASLTIGSQVPLTQGVVLTNPGGFYPQIISDALDKLTILIQQALTSITGAIRIPEIGSTANILPPVAQRANQLLGFDSNGNPVTVAPVSGSAASLASDIANGATASKGAGQVGFSSAVSYLAGTVGAYLNSLALSGGSALISTILAGTGAITRSLQTVLREIMVSAMGYGAIGNAPTTDDTVAMQALLTYVQSTYDPATYASQSPANGRSTAFIPAGYFKLTSALNLTKKVALVGDGPAEFSSGTRLVQYTGNTDLIHGAAIAQGASLSIENMSLISNAGGTGSLVHIQPGVGGAAFNSQRYNNLVFGTPQSVGLNIEIGDDIMCRDCLWDVSATTAIALGTSTSTSATSNMTFVAPRFFQVAQRAFLLYNVQGLQIIGASVYPSTGTNYMQFFLDGTNSLPYQINGVSVIGGIFTNVQTFLYATNANNVKIQGITAINASPVTVGFITPVTAATNLTIVDNTISGNFLTKKVYDDSGATVTGANITGNTFVNTGGGTVAAMSPTNTTGRIANNTFIGFNLPCVSQRWFTTGSAIAPGTIAAASSFTFTLAIAGAAQGDTVTTWSGSLTDPIPNGITARAWISAAGTLSFKLTNNTAAGIAVTAFDYGFLVER